MSKNYRRKILTVALSHAILDDVANHRMQQRLDAEKKAKKPRKPKTATIDAGGA